MSDEKPDNILDDVRAAAAEVAGGDNAPVGSDAERHSPGAVESAAGGPEAHAGETAEQAAERARDEKGRFAKAEEGKPRDTLKLKEKPQEQAARSTGATALPPEAPAASQAATGQSMQSPPLHWKGAAKVDWNKLPEQVKLGILDDHKAVQEQQAALEPLTRAIDPHREVWTRDAGSVENAISQLGQFYRAYLDNPVGLIQHIARTRGIDLGQSQGQPYQPQGAGTPQAPDIASLIRQAAQQEFAPIREQMQQAESQQYQQTIESFARDSAHPYFQDVKVHMGHLLKAGQAKDMQDAYDQATWANPVIRQQLIQANAEEARKTATADADKARKAAAASVRGSPLPGASLNGRGSQNSSVHDEVRAAWAEVVGQ